MATSHTRRFADRTAVVTGAASGIGRAIAAALALEGATVVLVDRSTAVEDVAARLGGRHLATDVAAPDFPERLREHLDGRRLDHLVTSAGVQVRTPAIEIAEDDWQRLLEVNLSSVYRLIRAFHDHLGAGSEGRPGSVVAISSMSADRAVRGIAPYGAVKAGLSHLLRGLAVELGAEGIRLNGIAPGYIATEMTAPVLADDLNRRRILDRTPLGTIGDPDDVARAALFLLSDDARFVTGQILAVDGGYALT
jgi:NAD(P)-dependent dehydrogenase (short-subunit alcohol dehydrogenase family)